jgi:hypothetical protein
MRVAGSDPIKAAAALLLRRSPHWEHHDINSCNGDDKDAENLWRFGAILVQKKGKALQSDKAEEIIVSIRPDRVI